MESGMPDLGGSSISLSKLPTVGKLFIDSDNVSCFPFQKVSPFWSIDHIAMMKPADIDENSSKVAG